MRLATAALLSCLAQPAAAGATAWQELGPDVRVRLITSDRVGPDGIMLAAIELDMPAGMKTYWRVPGETGIATEIDFSRSPFVLGHRLVWPYPAIEKVGGYTDFVYHGPTVIPLELQLDPAAGEGELLLASLIMGICSDICIPAMAEFSLPLTIDTTDTGQEIRISQALAAAPAAWSGTGEPLGEPLYDSEAEVLWVPYDPALVAPESLVAEAAQAGYLFGAPQKSLQPGLVGLPLLPSGDDGAGLAGAPVTLLFTTPDGPYEIARTVGLADAAE